MRLSGLTAEGRRAAAGGTVVTAVSTAIAWNSSGVVHALGIAVTMGIVVLLLVAVIQYAERGSRKL